MKVRLGFVTNSSSTSFCIVGVYNPPYEGEDSYDLEKDGLEVYVPPDGGLFVGLSIHSLGGDETLNQFKARVQGILEKAGVKVDLKDIKIHEEAYYNG